MNKISYRFTNFEDFDDVVDGRFILSDGLLCKGYALTQITINYVFK